MCKFVNVFSKLGFFVFAMATFTPAFSQLPEDIIDASVESAVEDAVSRAVESDVEETVETAVEQSVENAVEDSIAGAVEGAIENSVAGAVENAIESNVAGAVEETVSSAIEATVLDDVLAETADTTTGALSAGVQGGARAVRRDVEIVIADDGRRVIRHEWVLVVSAEDASEVAALGAPIVVRTPLEASGETLFVLNISDENPNAREIQDALAALGGDRFDRNSLFEMTAGSEARSSAPVSRRGGGAQNPPPGAQTIGLIDTAIESDHPALAGVGIEAKDFVSIGNKRPLDHGTAVASLIANAFPFGENIETPQVYAASVFFQTADGATGATTASLITAIDWLRREGVSVVNFSLAGGQNSALEKVIRSAQEDGVVFVAAVGNDGPAARPLYPAAYENVIGVTAVDENGDAYRWALRGPQVDVAARGVNVRVARPGGGHATDSGTSLAAPLVATFLVRRLPPHAGSEAAMSAIRKYATPGDRRDDVTGYGLLAPNVMN